MVLGELIICIAVFIMFEAAIIHLRRDMKHYQPNFSEPIWKSILMANFWIAILTVLVITLCWIFSLNFWSIKVW